MGPGGGLAAALSSGQLYAIPGAMWPLQISAARLRMAHCLRIGPKVGMSLPRVGSQPNWHARAGLLACHSRRLPMASISTSVLTSGSGGGGPGLGAAGGGGGGGGDEFRAAAAEGQAIGADSDDTSPAANAEDVIILEVGGMSCGGCAASVKKILEAQPRVSSAVVNLATETALVRVNPEAEVPNALENAKRELAEFLAKHLTSCGFKSSVREGVL